MSKKPMANPSDAFKANNIVLGHAGAESVFDGMRLKPFLAIRSHSAHLGSLLRKDKGAGLRKGEGSIAEIARPGGFRQQYVKTRRRKVTTVNLEALAAQLQVSVGALMAGMTSASSQAPMHLGDSPVASFVSFGAGDRGQRSQRMTTTTMRNEPNPNTHSRETSPLLTGSSFAARHVKISANVEERVEEVTSGGSGGDAIIVQETKGVNAIFVQDDDNAGVATVGMTGLEERTKKKKKKIGKMVTFAAVESVVLFESNKGHPDNVMMMKVQLALPRVAWAFLFVSVMSFAFVPLMLKQLMTQDVEHVGTILSYSSWQSQGVFGLVCIVSSAMAPFFSDRHDFLETKQGMQHVVAAFVLITLTMWALNVALMRTTSLMQASLGWGLHGPLILLWRWLSQDVVILRNEVIGAALTLAGMISLLLSEPKGIASHSDGVGILCAVLSGITTPLFFLTLKSMRYRLPVHLMMIIVFGGVAFLHVSGVIVYNSGDLSGTFGTAVLGWREEPRWWGGLVVLTFLAYFTLSICATFFDPFTMAIALAGQLVFIRLAPLMTGLHDEHTDVQTAQQWAAILIGGFLSLVGAGLGAIYSARERSLVHVHLETNANLLSATMGAMFAQQATNKETNIIRGNGTSNISPNGSSMAIGIN